MAPGHPKRSKINSNGIGDPNGLQKIFRQFQGWGAKSVCMLNEQCQSYLDRIILLEMGYKKISVAHLDPQYPKIPLEFTFDLFGGPGAIFKEKDL